MSSDDKGGEYLASLLRPPFEHTRSCPALIKDACTCGLEWRIRVATEQQLHAAWRKRAEEAEARSSCPPAEPSRGLLLSIALRLDHGLLAPTWTKAGSKDAEDRKRRIEVALNDARRAWEEINGRGFWSPERDAMYEAMEKDGVEAAELFQLAPLPESAPVPSNAAGPERPAVESASRQVAIGNATESESNRDDPRVAPTQPCAPVRDSASYPAPAAPVSAIPPRIENPSRLVGRLREACFPLNDQALIRNAALAIEWLAGEWDKSQRSSSTTLTVPRSALDRAAYALFEIKRFVDAGPMTRRHAAEAHEEACKVLEEASVSATTPFTEADLRGDPAIRWRRDR